MVEVQPVRPADPDGAQHREREYEHPVLSAEGQQQKVAKEVELDQEDEQRDAAERTLQMVDASIGKDEPRQASCDRGESRMELTGRKYPRCTASRSSGALSQCANSAAALSVSAATAE